MYQAFRIVRKDTRRFLSEIVIVATAALFVALFQNHETDQVTPNVTLVTTFEVIFTLFAALLIANVIHEDRIPGDTQFWVTRPYRWQSLLSAKILFILLFVNGPAFLAQVVIVRHAGFSFQALLLGCLWLQVVLFVFVELPMACISMLTANLKQFVVTIVASVGPVFIYSVVSRQTENPDQYRFPPFSVDWLGWTIAGTIVVLAGFLIGVLQYRRMAAAVSRAIAVFAWITAVTVALVVTSWELAAQSHLPPQSPQSSEIHLDNGSINVDAVFPIRIPDVVEVRLSNIVIEGVPPGFTVRGEQVFADVRWPFSIIPFRFRSFSVGSFSIANGADPRALHFRRTSRCSGTRRKGMYPLTGKPSPITDNMSCLVSTEGMDATAGGRILCFPVFRLLTNKPFGLALLEQSNTASFINGILVRNSAEPRLQSVSYSPFPAEFALDPLNNMRMSMIAPGKPIPVQTTVRVTEEEVVAHLTRYTTVHIRLGDVPVVTQ